MSKQAQLPPRVPLQKKNTSRPTIEQEERPTWLNDLLSESDSNFTGTMLRRAASDPLTLSNSLMSLPDKDELNDVENPDNSEPDDVFESSCTYGPNSPRSKNMTSFPENEIVSAFPDYVVQNPVQHLDGHITVSGIPQLDSFGSSCASAGVINAEPISMNRHPGGQRSRVRKLQYIAELERTVQILQNLGSNLSTEVASVLQQRVALSMENNALKQQLLIMQQEKFIADGEYLSLKEELERLKASVTFAPPKRKVHNWAHPTTNFSHSDYPAWDTMLDMGKLNLK